MVYIRGVMLHPSMARLATVENLCNILPTWFIQKPKARARCSGLIAVCPESLLSGSPVIALAFSPPSSKRICEFAHHIWPTLIV